MNIISDLAKIRKERSGGTPFINKLIEQQNELEKNIHLAKTINAANILDSLVKSKTFSSWKVELIQVMNVYEDGVGQVLNFEFYDASGFNIKNLPRSTDGLIIPVQACNSITFDFMGNMGINLNYTSKRFQNGSSIDLKVGKNIGDDFLDIMLSKELISRLSFAGLEFGLKTNYVPSKKPKL